MTPLMLLAGLGNPGSKYAGTRHNVGFMVLDRMADSAGRVFKANSKLHGDLADIGSGDQRLRLLKPQTYMNESGRSIGATLNWFGWSTDQVLVIVDELLEVVERFHSERKIEATNSEFFSCIFFSEK